MFAYITKKQQDIDGAKMSVSTGDIYCGIVTDITQIPQGSQRVPLSVADTLMHRPSSHWIRPNTSTEGTALFSQQLQSFLNYMKQSSSSSRISETSLSSSSAESSPIAYTYTGGKMSLLDVQEKRDHMKKYRSR